MVKKQAKTFNNFEGTQRLLDKLISMAVGGVVKATNRELGSYGREGNGKNQSDKFERRLKRLQHHGYIAIMRNNTPFGTKREIHILRKDMFKIIVRDEETEKDLSRIDDPKM